MFIPFLYPAVKFFMFRALTQPLKWTNFQSKLRKSLNKILKMNRDTDERTHTSLSKSFLLQIVDLTRHHIQIDKIK